MPTFVKLSRTTTELLRFEDLQYGGSDLDLDLDLSTSVGYIRAEPHEKTDLCT